MNIFLESARIAKTGPSLIHMHTQEKPPVTPSIPPVQSVAIPATSFDDVPRCACCGSSHVSHHRVPTTERNYAQATVGTLVAIAGALILVFGFITLIFGIGFPLLLVGIVLLCVGGSMQNNYAKDVWYLYGCCLKCGNQWRC